MPYSADLVENIESIFEQFRQLHKLHDPKNDEYKPLFPGDWLTYNVTHSNFCKKIYLGTKNFFEIHQDELSPTDKTLVLRAYFKLWVDIEGKLEIKHTDFAEQYKNTGFSKYVRRYNPHVPMMAGFNLKNIVWGNFSESDDLMFPAVNFRGADFNQAELPYGSFHDCDFLGSTIGSANFNQSRFDQCNVEGLDFSNASMCEVVLNNCKTNETKFNKRYKVTIVEPPVNVKPYPLFLQNLKIKPKNLSAERVANALWLSDKDGKTTQLSKSQFRLWAEKQDLSFKQNEVEECLLHYMMKK